MKVILLSSIIPATGNNTTIRRLRHFIESGGYEAVLEDISKSTEEILKESRKADCAIGLHAYHSGKHLRNVLVGMFCSLSIIHSDSVCNYIRWYRYVNLYHQSCT